MLNKTTGALILVFGISALLFWRHTPYFLAPNDTFFGVYGDGIKNYATVVYHTRFDSTYTLYQGMNYPYGEHVLFADCQPLLANTIKWISTNITDISGYSVAIVNMSMMVSFVLCGLILYLILLRWQVPVWYSVLTALGLTLLAPQQYRVYAHFGLAHAFVIPLLLYLLLRWEEGRRWWFAVMIGLTLAATAQLHFYFFGIGAFFTAFYLLFSWLRKPSVSQAVFYGIHYVIMAVLPFAFLQTWLHWANNAPDRPNAPSGFLNYQSYWEGIFLSEHVPWWRWLDKQVVDIRDVGGEAEAYIGVTAGVLFLILLFRWLGAPKRRSFLPYEGHTGMKPAFRAAFVVLLLSFGLPFSLPGLSGLLDWTGPYQQFRGICRFSWAFYFVWGLIAFYTLYRLGAKYKRNAVKALFWAPAFLMLGLDAAYFVTDPTFEPQDDFRLHKAQFESSDHYWFKTIQPRRYQAVLPLPFYHVGSENFQFDYPGDLVRYSLIPGWHYGIPSMGVFLSRTPFSQTLKSIQLGLEPYRRPAIIDDLPNDKPFLVVLDKIIWEKVDTLYRHYLPEMRLLYEDEYNFIMEMQPKSLDRMWQERIRQVNDQYPADSTLYFHGTFAVQDSAAQYYYNSFDDLRSDSVYRGTGAFQSPVQPLIPLYEGRLPGKETEVYCSMWVYMGKDQYPRINSRVWEIDAQGNEELIVHNGFRIDIKVLDPNGWGLVEYPIRIKDPSHSIRLMLECKEMHVDHIYVDELMFRPMKRDVWGKIDGEVVKNNRWYPGD